ncbi:MAG: FKBP-type peptidyl-prolyl cis-trans isomerase [Lachnospiraceae bacterium]|nr:FKBP-type peptidyl-prolyl cis-trans isomerase [Lachnospiraceae bacterium]
MKKENRKAAQQRRAEERRKLAKKKKIKKILTWVISAAVVILLLLLVIFGDQLLSKDSSGSSASSSVSESSDTTSDSSVSDSSATDTSSGSTAYSTDTSLTIEDGDTVNIDYVGSIDGVEFEGGSTNGAGTDLTIGSGLYIDDFEEQLIGAHPGDSVEVNVTFPDDYQQEDLQGKDALFQVTINGIYEN